MNASKVDLSSEEAAALLTCLEYYVLNDLQSKEKHRHGLLPDYEAIPENLTQILNDLRTKLLAVVKGSGI